MLYKISFFYDLLNPDVSLSSNRDGRECRRNSDRHQGIYLKNLLTLKLYFCPFNPSLLPVSLRSFEFSFLTSHSFSPACIQVIYLNAVWVFFSLVIPLGIFQKAFNFHSSRSWAEQLLEFLLLLTFIFY